MPIILYVDINSFFVSVEIANNPKLKVHTFLAVAGSESSRKGVIMTANYASRDYGVKAGMSNRDALQLCPNLKLIPPHMDLYKEYSNKVMEILLNFTHKVEKRSIDEACMDISDLVFNYNNAKFLASKIINEIKKTLDISVSVGLSFNKSMAKLGSDLAGPLEVFLIAKESIETIVWPLPVKYLMGAGPKTCKKLRNVGINTIGDLAKTDILLLKTMLKKQGEALYNCANGLDASPVNHVQMLPKSIGNSKTVSSDMTTIEECEELLKSIAISIEQRLLKYQATATTISIAIRTNDFNTITRQKTFEGPISSGDTIYKEACLLFKENWKTEIPVRLLGISMSGIEYFKRQLSFMDMI